MRYNVIIIDDFSTGKWEYLKELKVEVVEGCITEFNMMRRVFKDYNPIAVFHFAAISDVEECVKNSIKAINVNVYDTLELLKLSKKFDVKKFIFTSSAAIYGKTQKIPLEENTCPNPISLYGTTKLYGENLCDKFYKLYGLNVYILRLFNIYWPKHNNSKPLTIFGDSNQVRDFVYAEDCISAIYIVFKKGLPSIFNIGNGKGISINSVWKNILNIMKIDIDIIYTNPRLFDINKSVADNRKLKYLDIT